MTVTFDGTNTFTVVLTNEERSLLIPFVKVFDLTLREIFEAILTFGWTWCFSPTKS